MELEGSGLIEDNPLFSNQNAWDFSYHNNSPCIDAGDPSDTLDPDGSIRDIGAHWYGNAIDIGDCNTDGIQNVMDVIILINCILDDDENCDCGDLNQDGIVNILDVVSLASNILNP